MSDDTHGSGQDTASPSDPFDAIFGSDRAVTPRASFTEELRRQMERDLQTDADNESDPEVDGTGPVGVNVGSLFYFTIPGADIERTATFYGGLFEWELHQGASGYHVANVYPPMGLAAQSSASEVWIEVDDIEAAVARVRELGGQAEDPVHYDSGWSSSCVDPNGVRFNLQVPVEHYRQVARRSTEVGELFYWTLPAPDVDAARGFYRELFGWDFGEAGSEGGMHVANRLPEGGLGGGRAGDAPQLFFRVADLDAAIARVEELGGSAEPAGSGPEGAHAMCVDDQGVPFGLSQPAEGY